MVKTTKIAGDKDYALVPDRIKEFREANPRAKITTIPTQMEDGGFMFQTTILSDKADENSAEATGTAMYNATEMKKPKSFEKLETISVGRALALLGYLNNGQVATSEEMVEFEEYKNRNKMEAIENAISLIESAEDLECLKDIYLGLGNLIQIKEVVEAKDKRKAELSK